MDVRHGIVTLALIFGLSACHYSDETPYRHSYNTLKGTSIGGGTGMVVGAITAAGTSVTAFTLGGAAIGAGFGMVLDSQEGILREMHKAGIQVMQIGDKKTIVLQSDMLFDPYDYQLASTANRRLDLVVGLLQKTQTPIMVTAYTDNIGTEISTIKLSDRQAEMVQAYLWTRGVDLHRLTATGKGSDFTIADNRTSKGSAYNRRVEIIF